MNVQDALTLVEYNAWASRRLLQQAARVSQEELTQAALLSHGSLLGTLIHTLDAQWYWRLGCQKGVLPVERLSQQELADMAALRKRWEVEDELLINYVRSLTDAQVDERVEYSWPRARPRSKVLWHILVHIVNHGTHHRSEIGNYLAVLGRSPGDMDYIIYVSKAH